MSDMATNHQKLPAESCSKMSVKAILGHALLPWTYYDTMIGSADRLALQDLQIPEHSTNRTLPKYTFPRRFPDKQRLTPSRPDAI
eukprot:1159739-Pelagomonas_calceolata.AAC.12